MKKYLHEIIFTRVNGQVNLFAMLASSLLREMALVRQLPATAASQGSG